MEDNSVLEYPPLVKPETVSGEIKYDAVILIDALEKHL